MRMLIIASLLLVANAVFAAQQHAEHSTVQNQVDVLNADPAQTLYVCPMHPHIQQHGPGSCPICGMALVSRAAATPAAVTVSPQLQQSLAIRVASAEKRTLWRFIDTFGQVQYPEDAIHHSHIRAEGWIEQLFVRSVGQHVKAGDKLFSYYAPDLLVAQDDYLQALSVSKQNGERSTSLLQRAETRLRLLGLSSSDISTLQQSRQSQYQITVYAHQDGVVTMLNVRDGMYIRPGDTLLEITRLDRVWVIADVPQAQQNWLRLGMAAELDIPSRNVYGIETEVDFIYPAVDAQSRSSKVRMTVANNAQQLQPNMLLPVRLYGGALRDVLTVPREAVLLSGRGARVIVQNDNAFSVRQILTGSSAQGYTEVVSGLHEGEQVVVSGQFLLDAEASLTQLPVSSAHQHQE
ncbi:MAG: efflux RND transporter periplasmic adaptor subunit [Rheinheimera sp.]|nr:efflux RND transporter periplasmic adaptor subunit [Rheinheimera sp.]